MVTFGISLPESCFIRVKTDGYGNEYYRIYDYGDWWWGKCDYLKVIYDDGLETYSYELGIFKGEQWVPMFGWGHDYDSIMLGINYPTNRKKEQKF